MTVSSGFADLLGDILGPLGRVTVRRMFSGSGVYCNGVMFGLVVDDTLFLKADEQTKRRFEDEGCSPFVYEAKGRTVATSYWRMPERLLDEPEEMVAWARIAFGIALRKAAAKPVKSKSTEKLPQALEASRRPKRFATKRDRPKKMIT